jgi:hypothetical protein
MSAFAPGSLVHADIRLIASSDVVRRSGLGHPTSAISDLPRLADCLVGGPDFAFGPSFDHLVGAGRYGGVAANPCEHRQFGRQVGGAPLANSRASLYCLFAA